MSKTASVQLQPQPVKQRQLFATLQAVQVACDAGYQPDSFDLNLACAEKKWDIAYYLLSRGVKANSDVLLGVAAGGECDLMIQCVVNGGGVLNHHHLVEAYQHKLNYDGPSEPNIAMTELIMNFGVNPTREDLIYAIRLSLHPIITLFLNGRGLIADNEHVVNACEVADEVVLQLLLSQERTIPIHFQAPRFSVGAAVTSPAQSCNICEGCNLCSCCGDKLTSFHLTWNAFEAASFKYNTITLHALLDQYAMSERRHLNFCCGTYKGHVLYTPCCCCACCMDKSVP